jgi:hypothetical protein
MSEINFKNLKKKNVLYEMSGQFCFSEVVGLQYIMLENIHKPATTRENFPYTYIHIHITNKTVMHSSYPEKKGVSYDLHVLQVIFNFYLS